MAIEEVLLVHHSHTDFGYTHLPTVAHALHGRFIDEALDLIRYTSDWPEDAAMRWTCESAFVVDQWIKQASPASVDVFVSACQRGLIEVTALWCNLTPLFQLDQLYRLLKPIEQFRRLGIPVRFAMNSDVNGLPWRIVDILLDANLEGLSMAVNEHMGLAPFKRPNAFQWQGPTGRAICVWNGFLYNDTRFYGIPGETEAAQARVHELTQRLVSGGYPYTFLAFQCTYPDFIDNNPPDLALCRFVRRWNQERRQPVMRMVTLGQMMQRVISLRPSLAIHRGEWNDYWAFGLGSAARDNAVDRAVHRRLLASQTLRTTGIEDAAWLVEQRRLAQDALIDISLYDEHTFGSSNCVREPDDELSRGTWAEKTGHLYRADAGARLMETDGLLRLSQTIDHGGRAGVLLFNPDPFPSTVIARAPHCWFTPDYPLRRSHLHSPWRHGLGAQVEPWMWFGPVTLPGWGYRWVPESEWSTSMRASHRIQCHDHIIECNRYRIELDGARGGLRSFLDKGLGFDLVAQSQAPFPAYFYETIDSALGRKAIYHHEWGQFASRRLWKTDWPAVRQSETQVIETFCDRHPDRVSLIQRLHAPGVKSLEYHFTRYPHREGIELEVIVDVPDNRDPHAIYVSFAFALSEPLCRFDSMGATVCAQADFLPETGRDFLAVQEWIDLSDTHRGITVVTPDAPLWMLGPPSFGRLQRAFPRSSVLTAWLMNNYWDTNFPVSQPGRVRFRFHFFPHARFEENEAVTRSARCAQPLMIPTTGQVAGSSAAEGQMLSIEAGPVVPLTLDLTEEGQFLLRLRNLSDRRQVVRIRPGLLSFCKASKCDASEKCLTPIESRSEKLELSIEGLGVETFLLV